MAKNRKLSLEELMADDPIPEEIEKEVERMVDEIIGDMDYLGICHLRWALKKKIFYDKYGIKWTSPDDEFPGLLID